MDPEDAGVDLLMLMLVDNLAANVDDGLDEIDVDVDNLTVAAAAVENCVDYMAAVVDTVAAAGVDTVVDDVGVDFAVQEDLGNLSNDTETDLIDANYL